MDDENSYEKLTIFGTILRYGHVLKITFTDNASLEQWWQNENNFAFQWFETHFVWSYYDT